jgi:hypothetical protein
MIILFLALSSTDTNLARSQNKGQGEGQTDIENLEPQINTSLKEIIDLDWSKDLMEIADIYPGGKLVRGDAEKRRLAFYSVDVKLWDLDTDATLFFNQNEEYILDKSQENISHRVVTLKNLSHASQKQKFDELIQIIRNLHHRVFRTKNPQLVDETFVIYDYFGRSGIKIDIEIDNNRTKNLIIHITQKRSSSN